MPLSASSPPTVRTLLRASVKGLLLYAGFVLLYNMGQPVLTGRLPTLYNAITEGRVRLITDIEPDLYVMLNDHVIQRATSDTWNILMLGSSETYGLYDVPDKALPMLLDRSGLRTPEGQQVRVYNLSYPIPDVAKDLLIADALLQARRPIDLIVLNVHSWSFMLPYAHAILDANPAATRELIARYQLSPAPFANLPPNKPGTFWADRGLLATWLTQQSDIVRWSAMRIDNRGNGPQEILGLETGINPMLPLTRAEGLRAFRQLSDQYGVPVLVVNVPRTHMQDDYLPWLYVESETVGLALLDCEFIFADTAYFLDSIHLQPQTDPLYARILAQHFSRDDMRVITPDLPLRLPEHFDSPQEECVFLPPRAS